ncbi:MAG: IS1634 family transposase [Phycisphaerae bacterium]|jgi:transposase
MYLRKYQRTKDGKRHAYFALVESRRTERGPRQHIVAQLGELTEDQQRRWQRTAVFHTRHDEGQELPLFIDATDAPPSPDPDVVRIRLGKVGWTNARAFGDVWLGWQLWRKLNLDKIVARHVKSGREDVPAATMVAIEVISRLCIGQGGETSEFGLAEHGYRRTALEDLLGIADEKVTKDRLYRTLDALLAAKEPIEQDLKEHLGELFSLQFDLLLCDLTSSFFEGLMEGCELARRGYSRDHRADCKQIVLAMIVTPDGFPVYHQVFAGNTLDSVVFPQIVETMQSRFGKARRVWVLDRGIATEKNLEFLREHGQSFLVGTPRSRLGEFDAELCTRDWHAVRPHVEVKSVQRDGQTYVLARSIQRRLKEKAIRRRQLLGHHSDLTKLARRVSSGHLKDADKVLESVGRFRERWPAASRFVEIKVERSEPKKAKAVTWSYHQDKLRRALARDGAYLLLSDQTDWSAEDLWRTYIQLTRAEEAFRAMKSSLLLRPMWHGKSERIEAHVFVCILAYALWKALDHMLHAAGLKTRIRKKDPEDPEAGPQDRPMSPEVALKMLHDVQIGDILLETVEGRKLRLRRIARPNIEQAEIIAALGLSLPERICADRDVAPREFTTESSPLSTESSFTTESTPVRIGCEEQSPEM